MKIPYKVSIIIPVYNGSRTLRKTLETAQRQRDPSFEVIVVDDGSTENISSLVRELGARHHRLPMNMGPAAARTEGARVASGQVLLFTDSDVWLPENTISIIRQAFEDHACSCVQGTFSKQCPYPDFFSQYKNLYNRYVLNRLPDWIETTYTSLTAIGREFFFECGGFDQNIRTASVEDRTLGENIIRHEGTIYLEKRLEVIHNKHLSPGGFSAISFAAAGISPVDAAPEGERISFSRARFRDSFTGIHVSTPGGFPVDPVSAAFHPDPLDGGPHGALHRSISVIFQKLAAAPEKGKGALVCSPRVASRFCGCLCQWLWCAGGPF
ncbi:MAG: glycosyltransferase family 2 protein [Candidatus Omnitrophica bacterium]|nr:glycosyltransferase family 2 protein [Candidatus Omnitrophota bacterium]